MTKALVLENLAEELQDHIVANATGLSVNYELNKNIIIGDVLDIQDFEDFVGQSVTLAIFDEGGDVVRSARFPRQERNFRFVVKGDSSQQAGSRARELFQWFWNDSRSFRTSHFRVWVARSAKLPSTLARKRSGTVLADFIYLLHAYNRV